MRYDDLLGRFATLPVRRFAPPGAFLAIDPDDADPEAPTLLLPTKEVPAGTREGDALDVFVYLDSEDRPIATTRTPKIALGEVAFLAVTDLAPFGAFVDWGLPKDLLVPKAEQTGELRRFERHPVGLYLDDSGRLAGTMKVSEMLRGQADLELDEWVPGQAWRRDPDIGVFVILERRYVGLLPASEPNTLARGEDASFRVASVLPDGKVELSLRRLAHEEVEGDAQRILAALTRMGTLRVGARSSPEQIRALFGLSKKAFKRAAGRLLKQGAASLDGNGFLVPARR